MTLPRSGERIACNGTTAVDRFEGEYPAPRWPCGRDAQALLTGYAPSKYRTKPWPTEALLEAWYSPSREVLPGFMLDEARVCRASGPKPHVAASPLPLVSRGQLPRSAVAVNANETPGVEAKRRSPAGVRP